MHGELNTKDVNNAKKFLQEKAYFGDIKDYSDIIEQLRHQFHWKSSTSISSGMVCMDKKLKKCFEEEARVLQYHRNVQKEREGDLLFHKSKEANSYDFSIYSD